MAVSKLNKGELIVKGRCDGMGDLAPNGSYVRIVYSNDLGDYGLTISEGAASVLVDELSAVLTAKEALRDQQHVEFLRSQSLYRPGQEGDEREWCRKMNAAADEIHVLSRDLLGMAERAAERTVTLDQVIQWWDGLPRRLRQDIEGSGAEPGCIAAVRRCLNT